VVLNKEANRTVLHPPLDIFSFKLTVFMLTLICTKCVMWNFVVVFVVLNNVHQSIISLLG